MRDKKLRKNQKGITLVEMLIYMGLLSVMLISLTEMFASILDIKIDSEAISSVEQDAQFISLRMKHDVNKADSITTPTNPGDTANTLVVTEGANTYTYAINGTDLELTSPIGTAKLNGSETEMVSMSVKKIGPSSGKQTAKVEFVIESKTETNTGKEQKTIKFTAGTR